MIQEEYEGITFKVEFKIGRPMRRSPKGKHWPLTTQCIIYRDDLIIGIGEVVKHANDPINPKYARVNSARKAFKQIFLWKEIRTRLWNKILNYEKTI